MGMRRTRTMGTPNIGVYAKASDALVIAAEGTDGTFLTDLKEVLSADIVTLTVGGARIVGSLVALNSNGAAVSNMAEDAEIEALRKILPVIRLPDEINAAGNNILVNDRGAVVTPDASAKTVKRISDVFGVEAVQATIAGISTVGSVCVCTNKGCICTPDATEDDVALLKDVLKVDVAPATANHGA